jgi:integrase/recombinase XerD
MRLWRADRSFTANSAQQYLQWIGQFRRYCRERGLVEVDELTRDGAKRFKAWYARSRKIKVANLGLASSSMQALRRVYEVMGAAVPAWSPIKRRPPPAMGRGSATAAGSGHQHGAWSA